MGRSRKKQEQFPKESLSDSEFRRYILFLGIPLIVLLLVIVAMIAGNRKSAGEETVYSETNELVSHSKENHPVIEPDTKEYFHNFGGSILEQDAIPEINQLMEQYFLSISECDMDTFMHLFTSQDTSQTEVFREQFEKQRQYIESYQNISCYTAKGLEADSYVAYVYYEEKFAGVETLAPGMVNIYAVKCEDGQYRIFDQEISPELEEYLGRIALNEDVRLLVNQVDRQAEGAMEADEELRKRITYLKNGPDYMQDEGQPEENPEGDSQAGADSQEIQPDDSQE